MKRRLYFHVCDGTSVFLDRTGTALDLNADVMDSAFSHIGDIRVSQPSERDWERWRLFVCDEKGAALFCMTFNFEPIDIGSEPACARGLDPDVPCQAICRRFFAGKAEAARSA